MKKYIFIVVMAALGIIGVALAGNPIPVVDGLPGSRVYVNATNLYGTVTWTTNATIAGYATNAGTSVTATNVVGYSLKTNTVTYLNSSTNLATNTVIYLGQ